MSKKRYIIIASVVVSVLLGSLFVNNIILAQSGGEYDPWMDLNDDGVIDAVDLQLLAFIYATSGTPIDKTALLLELEARIDSLNATLLNDYYNITDCDSLFALLAHTHSGWDISGGRLAVDEIQLGTSEGNRYIWFYDSGSTTGEYIRWWDSADQFYLSDDTRVIGDIYADTIDVDTVVADTIAPPTARYYSVPASAWLPDSTSTSYLKTNTYLRSYDYPISHWFVPVNLPHGAVVTELRAWVYDNDEFVEITVSLRRQSAGTYSTMATVDSISYLAAYRQFATTSISNPTIDNQNYAYYLYGLLRTGDLDHRLSNVRITYTNAY